MQSKGEEHARVDRVLRRDVNTDVALIRELARRAKSSLALAGPDADIETLTAQIAADALPSGRLAGL